MAEKDDASTQQQGAGEAKTDAGNAANQKGADQGDGKQQQSGTDDKGADQSKGADTKGAGDKAADTKADDKKAADDAKSKAPEKYDLKLSDGSLLDSRTVDKIAAIAREQGLSNDDAQAHLAAIETEAMTERNARVVEWNDSVKADKELGGEQYATTLKSVQRYGGYLKTEYPELLEVLERTGYTSHPAVVRFLRDQGNRMAEDKHEQGGSGRGKKEKAPLENRLFPNSPEARKPSKAA